MNLETRYRRLLRAYPAAWRAHREDEMTATFLEAAGDRRTLTFADRWDVWRGAARHRAAVVSTTRVGAGARAAANLAFMVGAALSAYILIGSQTVVEAGYWSPPLHDGVVDRPQAVWMAAPDRLGPFNSFTGYICAAWVLAAIAAIAPARWTRYTLLVVLGLSVVQIPLDEIAGPYRMWPFLLVALGAPAITALAVGRGRNLAERLLPVAAMVPGAVAGLIQRGAIEDSRGLFPEVTLLGLGQLLLIAAVAVTVAGWRRVAAWPMLFLAPTIASFGLGWVSPELMLLDFDSIAAKFAVLGIVLIGVPTATLLAATTARGRDRRPPQAS